MDHFSDFLNLAKSNIDILNENFKTLKEKCAQLAKYFCEKADSFKVEEFLGTMFEFARQFVAAIEQNAARKVAAKKAEERKKAMEQMQEKTKEVSKGAVIDSLLSMVHKGDFSRSASGMASKAPPTSQPTPSKPDPEKHAIHVPASIAEEEEEPEFKPRARRSGASAAGMLEDVMVHIEPLPQAEAAKPGQKVAITKSGAKAITASFKKKAVEPKPVIAKPAALNAIEEKSEPVKSSDQLTPVVSKQSPEKDSVTDQLDSQGNEATSEQPSTTQLTLDDAKVGESTTDDATKQEAKGEVDISKSVDSIEPMPADVGDGELKDQSMDPVLTKQPSLNKVLDKPKLASMQSVVRAALASEKGNQSTPDEPTDSTLTANPSSSSPPSDTTGAAGEQRAIPVHRSSSSLWAKAISSRPSSNI